LIPVQQTALIVVDMQNGFCRPDGSMARIAGDIQMLINAVAPCVALVDLCRQTDMPIIFTRFVFKSDYSDGGTMLKLLPVLQQEQAIAEGSWDADFLDELMPQENDHAINKNRPSAFYNTNLDHLLRRLDINNVMVCGVTTNCCVEATVRDASQRDFNTYVVSDATGELERARHDAALKTMGFLFATVVTVDDVRKAVLF
jgi:nicotinamidase-related amidase